MYTSFYDQNKTILYTLFILTVSFFILITEEFLITENHYIEHFGQQVSVERIESILTIRSNWHWLTYLLIPLIYLIKFTLLSIWMIVGIIFFGYRASFKDIFKVVLVSEFVFLIPTFLKTVWFGLVHTDFTLEELTYFIPLSLINLFDPSTLDPWWIYPLQSLNIFEIVYVLVLSIGIGRIILKPYAQALRLTLPVYISGLLIWIIFTTFLTLNFS